MYYTFHLFGANFTSQQDAENFAFEQWEPEPDALVSDVEYEAWEDRNPKWELENELGFYMNSDFVELATGTKPEYIESLIQQPAEKVVAQEITLGYSHLIIIGDQAIYGDRTPNKSVVNRKLASTKTLNFLGTFNAKTN